MNRSRTLAFAALLLGGLLGLVAAGQPWWRASGGGSSVSFSGSEASGGLTSALAAVVLAGVLLALALRAGGRQVIAGLLVLTGLGMIVTGVLRQRPSSQGVLNRLAQVTLADSFALAPTAWCWVYALGGLIVASGALVMLLRARGWPVRTARFDRTDRSPVPDLADDPTRAWQALDAGEDPTLTGPGPVELARDQPEPDAAHPDVQSDLPGDTMGVQGGSDTRREPS
jgi:uncharacterized membrane protein (TIGR02234 family)